MREGTHDLFCGNPVQTHRNLLEKGYQFNREEVEGEFTYQLYNGTDDTDFDHISLCVLGGKVVDWYVS